MTTNRPVFTCAPPEPDRKLPVVRSERTIRVPKRVTTMTRAELQADMQRNPKLERVLLDQFYAGRLKGVEATDIIAIAEDIRQKAKASLSAKARSKVNAVGALAGHVHNMMGGGQ